MLGAANSKVASLVETGGATSREIELPPGERDQQRAKAIHVLQARASRWLPAVSGASMSHDVFCGTSPTPRDSTRGENDRPWCQEGQHMS
mmetsp:Transcript_15679/g.23614  ORF Transcript_15679/g.23614 Transcript_15679/m.23614 type:complete len:90 (-) Transcript_15679:63-332(-)